MEIVVIMMLGVSLVYLIIRNVIRGRYIRELEEVIKEQESEIKNKAKLVMIGDYVEEYRKGGNAFSVLRKISDTIREV